MKIVMVMAGNEEGGLEKHVEELVAGLADRGHEVTWIAHPKYADRVRGNARFEAVDLTRSRRNPLALLQLWRILNRLQPDVVHAQANKALAMVSIIVPFLQSRIVITIHNEKKRHAGIHRADAVIAVSKQIKRKIRHPNTNITYNGLKVDKDSLKNKYVTKASPRTHNDHNIIWLGIGRLVEAKGFDILVTAMTRAPGSLWIAGEGPEREGLERQIARLGLTQRVSLLGHREDIPTLLKQCHSLVIASRREGFSYVFAEALFNRCPVISTNVPIPNEVLPHHLICPTDDATALANLMIGFRPDPGLIDSLADFAARHLTLDSMVDGTLNVYEEVLAGRAR
jgi:glycosyltransferase involved in cell wall biosynthesis